MKNITGFAVFVFVLWGLFSGAQVWGQGHAFSSVPVETGADADADTGADTGGGFPYALSLSSSPGFLYGRGEEIVYKYPGNDIKLSELRWDVKPLFYLGAALDFSRKDLWEKPGVFSTLSLKFGFPGRMGIVEDRDWMTANDELTHYSRSDSYGDGTALLDLLLGASLPAGKWAVFKIYWTFSWMSVSWAGRDGYSRYSASESIPLDDSAGKKPLSGVSALYLQNWIITSPGLAVQLPLFRYFRADISIQVSPFVFCLARDDHLWTDTEYRDSMFFGLYIEPRGDFVFPFWDRFELALSVSYRYIQGGRGDSWLRVTGAGKDGFWYKTRDSGAAWYALDSALTFKVRL